jgi:hypothetical protein
VKRAQSSGTAAEASRNNAEDVRSRSRIALTRSARTAMSPASHYRSPSARSRGGRPRPPGSAAATGAKGDNPDEGRRPQEQRVPISALDRPHVLTGPEPCHQGHAVPPRRSSPAAALPPPVSLTTAQGEHPRHDASAACLRRLFASKLGPLARCVHRGQAAVAPYLAARIGPGRVRTRAASEDRGSPSGFERGATQGGGVGS